MSDLTGLAANREPQAPPTDDLVQPFLIERSGLRGRYVRLNRMIDDLLNRHEYPLPVASLLGETVTLACILSSSLKFDGIFTLQARGDGPVSLLMADVTSAGDVRGYARFDSQRLPAAANSVGGSVPDLLGKGQLVFTVDQGRSATDRYQGIVALTGSTLAECFRHYFQQSEQIDIGIKLAVGPTASTGQSGWRATGMMVQRLPDQQTIMTGVDRDEDWRRTMILMGSATEAEMLDPGLTPNTMLVRLFHEEGVRIFEPMSYRARCRCSRHRVASTLSTFAPEQLEEFKVDGTVNVVCEFCNTAYDFSEAELSALSSETS